MNKSITLFLSFCFIFFLTIDAKTYYVAPDGDDTSGNGSISAPFATIMKAHALVVAGDTVFMRGGTYMMSESQIALKSSIWAYMNYMDKSGTSASKRIHYWAYPGEKPVINMSNVKPAGYRNIVFYVKGSYIHFKGLEIIGTQVTILTHTQSECFRNEGGSNNIYEQCSMHDGMAIGFYLTKGANNLVLNCDAYNNWDSVSETGRGGNVDGFGFHGNKGSTGNVIRGCRAWLNSDDGYDCINNYENVTFENCQAFYNGYSTGFVSRGDGNGFKIGGYGQAPVVSSLPSPLPAYTVRFCMAYRNKANGFYANHHVEKGSFWYNNTAYRNSTSNFNMLSQKITKSIKTGKDTTIDCSGINHVLHNNISFRYSTQKDTLNIGSSLNTFNSFSPLSGVIVDANDFLSISESLLITPRQSDGSLTEVNFLKLKSGSDLIDKGKNLGFTFFGLAPDLGAYESDYSTGITDLSHQEILFYPNPVRGLMHFNQQIKQVEIIDIEGRIVHNSSHIQQLDLSDLKNGIYLIKLKLIDNSILNRKFIKKQI
jgi:parallel beta-helix repeat protein